MKVINVYVLMVALLLVNFRLLLSIVLNFWRLLS